MKKSNASNFKKLALLGVAGGVVFAGEATASDLNNYSQLLAFNGCGGSSGCHSSSGQGSGTGANNNYYQAYRNVPSQSCHTYAPQGQYYQPSQQSQGSNSYAQQNQYYQPSQPSQSCHSYNQQNRNYQPSQASQGCQSYTPQNQYYQPSQAPQGSDVTPGSDVPFQPASGSPTTQRQLYTQWETRGYTADASKSVTNQRSLTESTLLTELNEQGKTAYKNLDSSGKALALKLADQECKAQNECKGLNSCKTDDHACAGKGSCAGTAKENFKDKNLAVKVAALKMAEKRVNAPSSKY